ncbi:MULTISPECIES: RHS domain-containing protein [unclassified Gilliamella]|uniref:RHS domain-containing protein n=1 Tax=unclassified Gilliamella TaxID=2685620 RepID=UPI00080E028C|nr:RHS domain-containing protein [Gilliamella apicola]OCG68656.1 hypothetical protein A9G30_04795 [Gilliamella apicola]OCG77737.1 hypothetical protein A9G42_04615 [Gilliamella apicola]
MLIHTNLNGCLEELTDANSELLWECSFQLWGKQIHEIEHESTEQNLSYQGQYLELQILQISKIIEQMEHGENFTVIEMQLIFH